MFERVFAAAPERPALVVLENGETESIRLTREQLRTRVLGLAATLQAATQPGDRALLVYPSGHEFAIAYLACLYAAIVPVPCYPPSRNRTDHRLAGIAANCEATLILTTDKIAAASTSRFDGYPALKHVPWLATSEIGLSLAARWTLPEITGDTTALLQYTSGSTSEPRGVIVSHTNLLASFHDMDVDVGHNDDSVMVTWLPLFHDMGLIYGLLQPLADGFLCVVMPPAAFLQQPARWLRALASYRGTHAAAPNFAYDLCVARIAPEIAQSLDLSSWKFALNAAEPVRADTLERFSDRFAVSGFNRHAFAPGYGLAEATIRVTLTAAADAPAALAVDSDALKLHHVLPSSDGAKSTLLVSSGTPVAETTVVIVDPETRQPCAADRIGEIWVAGRTVACGYFKNPAATAETFAAHVAGDATPYMRTGDLGFMRDGAIYITGRLKDVIILRGLNYYPQDIERTVEQCDAALAASGAAAFGVEIDGEERLAVVAEVARTARRKFDAPQVFDAMHRALSDAYDLSPDWIVLIDPHALPKTSSGKVRRKACRDALLGGALSPLGEWRRAAADAAASSDANASADLQPVRDWLIARFAARLACPPASVDTGASLAQFGLDSLEAVTLSDELEQYLGRPVPVGALYDHPTIDGLARHLAGIAEPIRSAAAPSRHTSAPIESSAIAVIGMGCRFPGADGPDAFWRLLRDGVDAVVPLPAERTELGLGATSAFSGLRRPGGFLDRIADFEPAFFGVSPREADRMDPQQRLMLEVAWEAFEDAGITLAGISGSRTGVFVGVTNSDYARLLMDTGSSGDMYLGTGSALSINANRLSYVFDLKGPSLAVDTACSSSLVAVSLACASLRRGECETALAGGVNLTLTTDYTESFAAAGMLAADGRCKTFDATADGYVRGEGAGVVVLKRLEDAERDGDRILAVVRGVATNQDGRSAGLTAPNGTAQQEVVRAALADAGFSPARVSYVEAHGTGTSLGDPIELNSLASVLREGRPSDQPCRVGSVKTNIGHLEGAAGAAGLIKTVLSLQHREIPASLNFRSLNPRVQAGGHIVVNATHQQWAAADGLPRVAGVSSFGFGGTNAHIVVEEYSGRPRTAAADASHLLTISARDHVALAASVDRHIEVLSPDSPHFADICFTSNTARTAMSNRVALVASSAREAAAMLRDWRSGEQTSVMRVTSGHADPTTVPGVTFLFTGQGASWPGMGLELYRSEPEYARAIAECSEILWPILGASLEDLLFSPSPDPLRDIVIAHTALFSTQYALSKVWAAWGVKPAAVIGHSLGEFAAAQVAGVVALEDALPLVATRAQLLQSIDADGVMFAAQATFETIAAAIAPWSADLSIAAVNAPTNIVVSGRRGPAVAATQALTAAGIKCTMLPHAQAFHSPLVDGIAEELAAAASRARFAAPRTPFFSTATGTWLREAPDANYWRRQVRTSVRFVDAIDGARASGAKVFVELGPHPTLITLGEQIAQEPCTWAASLHGDRPARTQMLHAAAELWAAGVRLDWNAMHRDTAARKTSLPTYPFQRTHHWLPMRSATVNARASRPTDTYQRQWVEREPVATTAPRGLAWMIFADEGGTGSALADMLSRGGARPFVVRKGTTFSARGSDAIAINAQSPDDYAQAVARASRLFGAPPDRVVHLWSLDTIGKPSTMALRQAIANGAMSAIYLAQALSVVTAPTRVSFVTSRATAAGSVVTDAGLLQSAIWGVGQTLAVESRDLKIAMIDLDDEDALINAQRLADELTLADVRDTQIAFREGRRLVAAIVAAESPLETRVRINADATYLISGGLGALGLAVAAALVDAGARHLILASRNGISTETRRTAIDALKLDGATVRTPILDISDEAAISALIGEITAEGRPLAGVVHAAGESGYTPTTEMTAEIFNAVFAGKALGAIALARATASAPLDFFINVSSMTSAWGSTGQAHYVAASHLLDILAQRMRQVDHPATSVALGPLKGGMLPTVIAEGLARRGVATIEMPNAAELLLRHASGSRAHAVAVEIDWALFDAPRRDADRPIIAPRPSGATTTPMQGALAARLSAVDAIDRDRLIADAVLREAASVLGIKAADWGDRRRGFFEMGMDSLTAVELRKRFEQLLGRKLPATLVFDHPSIDALHRILLALISPAGDAPAVAIASASSPPASRSNAVDVRVDDDALTISLERLERLVARH